MGITLAEGETAYRCNLVTLEKNAKGSLVMVDFSAGHIPTAESNILINGLQDELGSDWFHFYPGIGYRHLMIYKNSLSDLETMPPHDYIGQDVSEFWERYMQYPELQLLLESAHKLLADHPVNKQREEKGLLSANAIWLWGEGKAPTIPTIEKQFGLKGSLISAVDLLKGIGTYGGLDIINVEGATGYLDTNYAGKAAAALKALSEQDFVLVHVEAPDEAGHQGSVPDKVRAIEDFDSKIVKPIFEGLQSMEGDPDFRLVVCMDHFTPISIRTHLDKPVPVLLYDSRQQGPESGLSYSEANGEKSNRLLSSGREFFNKLLQKDT
jgi:2,3-bisphosphoglycerate-independent phosphoglycerate mutase